MPCCLSSHQRCGAGGGTAGGTVVPLCPVSTTHPTAHGQAMMFAEADAFISIPGGFGTLDEMLEVTTW